MTRPMILLGSLAVFATLAGPAMAQRVIANPGGCARFDPNADCRNYGPNDRRRATNPRHLAADRYLRQPVGRANLSTSYW